jgi:serine protease Do
MPTALQDLSQAVASVADRAGPSVVGLGRGWSVGSGFVLQPGRVVVSSHSLRRDEPSIVFSGGEVRDGRVAGADSDLGLAIVEIDTGDAPALEWADGAEPELGTAVVALGNPGGRGLRATLGFVSSAGRTYRGPRGRRFPGAIEHTAPLPRGSSAGPLVDPQGRLLGINAMRLTGGLILALPADANVRGRLDALSRGEIPTPRRLGVAIAPPRVARRLRRAVGLPERDGLLVRAVEGGSPAEAAGVERGDLIVSAGGRDIDGLDALYAGLDAVGEDGRLELVVVRGTEERTVTVSFGPTATEHPQEV